jgi:recombination protein RecA
LEKEKEKSLDSAISQIVKSYGKGSIMKLGEQAAQRGEITVIPTGALLLDLALGVGGIPRGRVTELYGPESAGKTTLALHVIAEAQKQGGVAAFVDAEHALDPLYASRIGVKIDDLLISQPDTGEQALEIVEVLVRSGAVDVIVIDSVAALVPKAEIEGEMGDAHVGLQARLMSQALRKLTAAISKSNPETQPGGRALKFYSSVRLDIRKVEVIKSGLDSVGARVKVKVVKNKVAPPFRSAEFDILFNEGISREGSLIDAALEYGILEKSGTWMSYGDQRLGQGRENVRNYLRENPTLSSEIETAVRTKAVGGTAQSVQRASAARASTDGSGGAEEF